MAALSFFPLHLPPSFQLHLRSSYLVCLQSSTFLCCRLSLCSSCCLYCCLFSFSSLNSSLVFLRGSPLATLSATAFLRLLLFSFLLFVALILLAC
uniref:Transmembrane protein n=1 Tax=Knipowitschia caucasica TaxID=637954 RepID=A0AAV2L1D1_KNICA